MISLSKEKMSPKIKSDYTNIFLRLSNIEMVCLCFIVKTKVNQSCIDRNIYYPTDEPNILELPIPSTTNKVFRL